MNKPLTALLACALALGVAGCDTTENEDEARTETATTQESTAADTDALQGGWAGTFNHATSISEPSPLELGTVAALATWRVTFDDTGDITGIAINGSARQITLAQDTAARELADGYTLYSFEKDYFLLVDPSDTYAALFNTDGEAGILQKGASDADLKYAYADAEGAWAGAGFYIPKTADTSSSIDDRAANDAVALTIATLDGEAFVSPIDNDPSITGFVALKSSDQACNRLSMRLGTMNTSYGIFNRTSGNYHPDDATALCLPGSGAFTTFISADTQFMVILPRGAYDRPLLSCIFSAQGKRTGCPIFALKRSASDSVGSGSDSGSGEGIRVTSAR